jgi:hypothetical protein
MFSKPKVQKGIPRPKHLMSTAAGTQLPLLIRDSAEEATKERGSEEGEKREKRGEAAQETERMQDSQPDSTRGQELWSYTSTPPNVFMACQLITHEHNFTFTLPINTETCSPQHRDSRRLNIVCERLFQHADLPSEIDSAHKTHNKWFRKKVMSETQAGGTRLESWPHMGDPAKFFVFFLSLLGKECFKIDLGGFLLPPFLSSSLCVKGEARLSLRLIN